MVNRGSASFFMELGEDHIEVAAAAAAPSRKVIVLELPGQLEICHGLLGCLASRERGPRVLEEQSVKLTIVDEVLPLHHRAMTGDDRVHVLDAAHGLLDRLSIGHATAAVVRIDERLSLRGKGVPACITRKLRNTKNASPLVCAGP